MSYNFIDEASSQIDPEKLQKSLCELKEQMTLNNGVLVVKDLNQFRNNFINFFKINEKNYNNKNAILVFDFLTCFLENNYGGDYEVQFTTHLIPFIIKSCLTQTGKTHEAAEETLEAYIRVHSQLAQIIDYLVENELKSDNLSTVISGVEMILKYLEFHPKIISCE